MNIDVVDQLRSRGGTVTATAVLLFNKPRDQFEMIQDDIRSDLVKCYHESTVRGLKHAAKWAAELLTSFPCDVDDISDTGINPQFTVPAEVAYYMSKSCFDLSEYERAAFHSKNSILKETQFLHYYSRYLAAEKKRLDIQADSSPTSQLTSNVSSSTINSSLDLLTELRNELSEKHASGDICNDSHILYVYAIVLLKLDLNQEAIKLLAESVNADGTNWASWNQLAAIIEDEQSLESLELNSHPFKKFFLGLAYIELQMNEEALAVYRDFLEDFPSCNYIRAQLAIVKMNLRDADGSLECFKLIRSSDPYRVDSLDVYSNLLYVKTMRAELSSLAHSVNSIDPFRVETCCCIANFYSLRSQHAKAILYFSRALQLNPKHLSAWTLMGHEYMEMKNSAAAIQAYRSAIKCSKRDYRAWYGLGQTYEILKMNSYCLYYYTIARCLRPGDTRMILAMGETLEKLDKHEEALKCYFKAGPFALVKLANLYVKMQQADKAAAAYYEFVTKVTNEAFDFPTSASDLPSAYKFLANYFLERNYLDEAQSAAEKCIMYPETKDVGKQILAKTIQLQHPSSEEQLVE